MARAFLQRSLAHYRRGAAPLKPPTPVRLLSRLDEDEEVPRAQVIVDKPRPRDVLASDAGISSRSSAGAVDGAVLAASPPTAGGSSCLRFGVADGCSLQIDSSRIRVAGAGGDLVSVGRGVFAGSPIVADSIVEVCPTLVARRDSIARDSSCMRYFFQAPDGDALLCVLGFGMLYNHGGAAANLAYRLHTAPVQDAADGGVCVVFVALRDIASGEELLIDYTDVWWKRQGVEPAAYPLHS